MDVPEVLKTDSVLKSVVEKYCERAQVGQAKYGHTMDRDDLDFDQWIDHLMEELMDATLYLQKLKSQLSTRVYEVKTGKTKRIV